MPRMTQYLQFDQLSTLRNLLILLHYLSFSNQHLLRRGRKHIKKDKSIIHLNNLLINLYYLSFSSQHALWQEGKYLRKDKSIIHLVSILFQGSKLRFFQGAQLHLHKLHKGAVYIKQYIFGLPAEIWASRRSIQGFATPPNFEPCICKVRFC